jgi:hypothetical protein
MCGVALCPHVSYSPSSYSSDLWAIGSGRRSDSGRGGARVTELRMLHVAQLQKHESTGEFSRSREAAGTWGCLSSLAPAPSVLCCVLQLCMCVCKEQGTERYVWASVSVSGLGAW